LTILELDLRLSLISGEGFIVGWRGWCSSQHDPIPV